MTYTTGDNGTRSLLNTVTESGKDEQGTVVTLPATTFSYQKVTSKGWVEQQGIHVLHDFTGGIGRILQFGVQSMLKSIHKLWNPLSLSVRTTRGCLRYR